MTYILVVDDEATLADLIQDVLSEEGYEVRCAANAADALATARDEQPALILFDITLPDLSGAEFIRQYRELAYPSTPLIAISGIVSLADEAARIGTDGYLVKPFEIEHLLAVVARALTRAS